MICRSCASPVLPMTDPKCPPANKVHKIDKVREIAFVDYGKVRMEVPYEDVSWLQPLDPTK